MLGGAALLLAGVMSAAPAAPASAAPAGKPATPAAGKPAAPATGKPAAAGTGLVVDPRSPALPAGIAAKAWLLADLGSGAVLAARDPHVRHLPASTIKILTALATLPGLPPDRVVTVTDADEAVDGTRVGLVPGMRYRIRELATAMLVSSGNDAATAIADAAGGRAATVTAMNAVAARLGAHDTHAVDPTGLDAPGQFTSAFDLALLGRAALASPAVRGYLTLPTAQVRGRGGQHFEIQNHNTLLGEYAGTIGVKNGYTVAAGATYIGAARRGGHTLIVTLLATNPVYATDARALLDWGFAHLTTIRPVGNLTTARTSRPAVPAAAAAAIPRPRQTGSGPAATTWLALALTAAAGGATLALRAYRRRPATAPHTPVGSPAVGGPAATPAPEPGAHSGVRVLPPSPREGDQAPTGTPDEPSGGGASAR
jgi:serine-type D-Ala-D-Ala carboxypeptidase (penicillin-binding protein 5/6)